MRPEDQPQHEVANGQIRRHRHGPGEDQHRFVERRDNAAVDQSGQGGRGNRGNHRQHGATPRVQDAARRCRFDDLLGHQREEERHRDLVHGERNREAEAVVAFGCRVDPDHGDQRAQRQQQQVLDRKPRQAWNGRAHPAPQPTALLGPPCFLVTVHCEVSFRMTPESTVLPVREIAWKDNSAAAISTSMKLWS